MVNALAQRDRYRETTGQRRAGFGKPGRPQKYADIVLREHDAKVTEVPVSHRPRRAGVSKYGNWGRLWSGLADLFAVRWMARRRLDYEIEEDRR